MSSSGSSRHDGPIQLDWSRCSPGTPTADRSLSGPDGHRIGAISNARRFERAKIWRTVVWHFDERLTRTGGAAATEISQFIERMNDPNSWFMDYALVAAWGQRQ